MMMHSVKGQASPSINGRLQRSSFLSKLIDRFFTISLVFELATGHPNLVAGPFAARARSLFSDTEKPQGTRREKTGIPGGQPLQLL